MGLFTPGWKNHNEEKALKALEKKAAGKNDTFLWRVVMEAEPESLKRAAIGRMQNSIKLRQVAQSQLPEALRVLATERITSQDSLCRIVRESNENTSPSGPVFLLTIKKLDQEHLVDAALYANTPERLEAILNGAQGRFNAARQLQIAQNTLKKEKFKPWLEVVVARMTDVSALEQLMQSIPTRVVKREQIIQLLPLIRDASAVDKLLSRYPDPQTLLCYELRTTCADKLNLSEMEFLD